MESKSSTMTTTDKLKRLGTDQARNFLNILSDLYDSGIAEDEILEKLSDPYGEGGMLKFPCRSVPCSDGVEFVPSCICSH